MSSVLIIDDNPDERELIQDFLVHAEPNVGVCACQGSSDGVPAAQQQEFDCVLLDLRLDGEDGLDVLATLHQVRPNLPVIVLSGQGSEQAATSAFVAGAAYYLAKRDLTSKMLWTAIERVIRTAATERELQAKSAAMAQSNRLDAVGQLAAGIAHDFNNQLGAMRMCLELLKGAAETDFAHEHLGMALSILGQSSELASRLLNLSRQSDLSAKDVPLADNFRDVRTLASVYVADQVTLEVADPSEDLVAFCDSGELLNAVLNLVLNASDAVIQTGGRGHVRVRAEPVGDAVHVTVSDSGTGMTPDQLAKCMDPFFTTKQNRNGTGLGLSMVQSFASDNGGKLLFETTVGVGTDAILVLPRGSMTKGPETAQPLVAAATIKGQRILLVEDEFLIAIMTKAVLEEQGCVVTMASEPTAALEVIASGDEFDLMITDINMPGMNGFALAAEVHRRAPEVATIYLTGYGEIPADRNVVLYGPVLQKPVEPEDLIIAINEVLAGSHAPIE